MLYGSNMPFNIPNSIKYRNGLVIDPYIRIDIGFSALLLSEKNSEWRFYAFADAGALTLRESLPEQEDRFELASVGLGSRIQFRQHFNGSIDAGLPLTSAGSSDAHDVLVTFRLWADF